MLGESLLIRGSTIHYMLVAHNTVSSVQIIHYKYKRNCQYVHHKSFWSTLSMPATLVTGSLSMDSRLLEVVKVVNEEREVKGGGMGSELIIL